MAKKKPKNMEPEVHKKAAKPNTSPIVNKKAQQKRKKKKKPQTDKKNLQKMETQRFNSTLSKIKKGIAFPEKSIFRSVDLSSHVNQTKKSVTYMVMIQPVLKNHDIGHVKEIVLMYSKDWTIDVIKKEILESLRRDSYDIILSNEVELWIKQRIIEVVKAHPDVVIDKELIPYTEWFCSRYFWLANAAINNDTEKGAPIRHKLTNIVINQSGEISFQYYQLPFVYKNGKIGTRKNYGQKQAAKFINENTEALHKCIAFQQSNKDEKRSIKMVINSDSLHITIGFGDENYKKHMTGKVDFTALEAWAEVVTEEYYKEKEDLKKKVETRLKKLKLYGSLLHRTILKMVAEREGKEWPDKDPYEREEKVITEEIYKTMGSGVSNMVSRQEIADAVEDLINCGLLRKKTMKKIGKNGRFSEMFLPGAKNTVLLPGADYKVFAEMPFERKQRDFESFTDMDWIDLLKNRMDSVSEDDVAKTLPLLEHRCVTMIYSNDTREFLKKMPLTWMEYAETMYEITDDEGEKGYWETMQRWLS